MFSLFNDFQKSTKKVEKRKIKLNKTFLIKIDVCFGLRESLDIEIEVGFKNSSFPK